MSKMSRRKTNRLRLTVSLTRRKRQVVIATTVALSLLAGWTMLAYSGGLDSAFRQNNKKEKSISPASLNSNSPSKEYIYSGGRLICTEEATSSTLSAPTNLRATTSSSTQIHITWNAVTGAARYELQRTSNYVNPTDHGFSPVSSNITSLFFDDTPTTGIATGNAYIYQVRAFDSGNNPSTFSNIDLASAVAFTEDPVSTGMTVKEAHVTQLRQAVDAVRVASGLSAATWTDPPPLAQVVKIMKVHIAQLRSNLDGARSALTLPAPTYTDPTIVQSITQVRAVHIQELRQLIKGYRTVTG